MMTDSWAQVLLFVGAFGVVAAAFISWVSLIVVVATWIEERAGMYLAVVFAGFMAGITAGAIIAVVRMQMQ